MTRTVLFAFLCLVGLPAATCTPSPTPPPEPPPAPQTDAGKPAPPPDPPPPVPTPGDAYDDACAALVAAGCPEGKAHNCAATLRHADTSGITKVPVACLASAKSTAAVRACGKFVECRP